MSATALTSAVVLSPVADPPSRKMPLTCSLALALSALACSAHAQAPLTVSAAAQLAAQNAPTVNPGTLVTFAYHESQLHPWAIHDNTSTRTYFPPTLAGAITVASSLLAQGDSLDLGVMQVNSANMARTGLTVASAFDAGTSMRAGAMILSCCLPAVPSWRSGHSASRAAGRAALRRLGVQHRPRASWAAERLPSACLARRCADRAGHPDCRRRAFCADAGHTRGHRRAIAAPPSSRPGGCPPCQLSRPGRPGRAG